MVQYGLDTLVLMESAGRGAADLLLSLGVHGPVLIVCGKGNNGGDGLVMARYLHQAEVDVKALLLSGPKECAAEAVKNLRILQLAGIPWDHWSTVDVVKLQEELNRAEWVVDALFGTGLQGPVRPPFDQVITAINACPARTFAVDIPTGLDGDTGAPLGAAIRALHTATFVAPKKGYANPAAAAWVGKVHLIDIGVPRRLVEDVMKAE